MRALSRVFIIVSILVLAGAYSGVFAQQGTGSHHGHLKQIEIEDITHVPVLNIIAKPDSSSGWNIQVLITNFRFSPENAGKKHVPGQGHAHLYVDGKKVARLYSPWFHLAPLSPGKHTLAVTLNANSHEEYAFKGNSISQQIEIVEEGK
jgi:hypothetical protein